MQMRHFTPGVELTKVEYEFQGVMPNFEVVGVTALKPAPIGEIIPLFVHYRSRSKYHQPNLHGKDKHPCRSQGPGKGAIRGHRARDRPRSLLLLLFSVRC